MNAETVPMLVNHEYKFLSDEGETIAMACVRENDDGSLWLTDVWVKKDQRGQGLATKCIVRAIMDWQRHALWLHVLPFTDRPMRSGELAAYYETFGFAPTQAPGIMHRPAGPWVGRQGERKKQPPIGYALVKRETPQ